jgi:hypothetical protein
MATTDAPNLNAAPAAPPNTGWSLEAFVDSLVVELDKTRETLAVKSINKSLTYTVKDMALDLQIFPTYTDEGNVRFVTAQPGQQGASKISLQLASITDQQVRATTKSHRDEGGGGGAPDVKIDRVVDLDPKAKRELRRLGVTSAEDLAAIERKNVDLADVTGGTVDYKDLANRIQRARRGRQPPRINQASLGADAADGSPTLRITGANLGLSAGHVPVAVVNGTLGDVVAHGPDEVVVRLPPEAPLRDRNDLILTLDPYCIVRVTIADAARTGAMPGAML